MIRARMQVSAQYPQNIAVQGKKRPFLGVFFIKSHQIILIFC